MNKPVFTQSLESLKRSAAQLQQSQDISHTEALNSIAKSEGYKTWALLVEKFDKCKIKSMGDFWHSVAPGHLVMLVARPGIGKVSLAINFAILAARESRKVIYISTFLEVAEIKNKLMAVNSSICKVLFSLPREELTDKAQALIDKGEKALNQHNIRIIQDKRPSIASISKLFSNSTDNPSLLVLDYIQHLDSENHSDTIYQLKKLARENNCSMLLVSQLRDELSQHEPSLDSLIGGKQMARHCDSVIGLHRAGVYNDEVDQRISDVFVLKSQMDSLEKVQIRFDSTTGIFSW